MQNKVFTGVIATLLALICLFYLSFSMVTSHHNGKAEEYAAGDETLYKEYIDSISTEKVYLGYYTYQQCREMEIGLGLDLKGGMNVTLQISVADVLKHLSNDNPDPNFNKAIANAVANQADNNDFLQVFVDEYEKLDPNVRLAAIFSTHELKDRIKPGSTNDEVISVLREELNTAVDNSYNVLRNRIDRFGVVAPNIQKLEKDGRILVELPGVKEPERVRNLLQGAANLEFWETYKYEEVIAQLQSVNSAIAASRANQEAVAEEVAAEEVVAEEVVAEAATTDSLSAALEDVVAENNEAAQMEQFRKQNPLFALLIQDQFQGSPIIGYAHRNDTAEINSMLASKIAQDILPSNLVTRWTVKAIDEKNTYYQLIALRAGKGGRASMSGDVVVDARDDFDKYRGGSVVHMNMNSQGAKEWEKLTGNNIGNAIAIVLDDQVYSFPNVNGAIAGGSSEISGGFTPEEAKDLANVLKSGKMAAGVDIIQEDVIGPSLGKEAINSGIISFIVALIILMIYMVVMYGFIPGSVVNCGLLINFFFTMGILASIQAVLTLSGIAGIVLALGMAVDANVLIFERTKEELRSGKNLKTSIADGYKNAFSAIFDSNLTSIITGVILLMYGTGPIKGFATTLIIGIVISFFIAVFLSRIALEWISDKEWGKNITFTTGISKNLLVNNNFNILGSRKIGFIISLVLVVIMTISFFARGVNQGIDFSGGRNYVVRFDEAVNTQEVNRMLAPEFEGSSLSVIHITSDNQVRISTNYRIAENGDEIDQEIVAKIYNGVKGIVGEKGVEAFEAENIMSVQKVGPSIAEDIKTGAMWAVFFSLIAIFLYILLRFRDIAFSVGTLVSLAFTTYVIIGLYSLFYGIIPFSMEIDQTFIAAILTVIGYAVNDTVVVFDRIREEVQLYPKRNRAEVINYALNSTLSRTMNTSLSTAVVLFVIFILGADTIRSFVFAMLFGVIVGTFATLFVATPIAYEIQKRRMAKKDIAFDDSVLLKK
ncbi:MAG: protein translocase subunit SecDF [Bacteroidaceae bacterium]|nr:protein translocase subunit SecDF [Bacteroidaceae bacterium]